MAEGDASDKAKFLQPAKGDFIPPPELVDADEPGDALPPQEEFWRPPVRFGSVPVEKEPLGWDRRRGFRKLFPQVALPFQVVERVSFGHPKLEPNRLFWGDNLHVMRQLPSESIDLIYIDPPFFSGRHYNVIFGDQNELRSFSDIWEGGMPGYLIWLNARLYEMKRLLKKTGTIYVHLDWHAVHYVKVEMDKIFGHENFLNEVVWHYKSFHGNVKRYFPRKHDTLLVYRKGKQWTFNRQFNEENEGTIDFQRWNAYLVNGYQILGSNMPMQDSRFVRFYDRWVRENGRKPGASDVVYEVLGQSYDTVWHLKPVDPKDSNRIGYPTQKPDSLLQIVIQSSSNEDEVVADFFCGGGTTPMIAQQLKRRWIACDQSRVAVAITADRIIQQVEDRTGKMFPVSDFSIEHWGVYELRRLAETPSDQFRLFVIRAFGAVVEEGEKGFHGSKGAIPVWVGEPGQKKAVTAENVQEFANAIRKTLRYKQDNLRDGIMLAWAFRPDAVEAAERLRRLEQTDLNFIRLEQVRIDSPRFREHVSALTTDHADYENFLTFVQSPHVEVGHRRITSRFYKFDASDTAVMNPGAKIINVQWDFDYDGRFTSTPGFSFVHGSDKEPLLQAAYTFSSSGKKRVACKVQDDMGGEGLWAAQIEVN